MLIILPIPSSEMGANKSKGKHWSSGIKLRKKAREDGYFLALEASKNDQLIFTKKDNLKLSINVYFINNKHLDDDNLLLALKNYQDGIFDFLKLQDKKVNDNQITLRIVDTSFRDKENPRVEWELTVRK